MSGCKFLPEADRRAIARVRSVQEACDLDTWDDEESECDDDNVPHQHSESAPVTTTRRVLILPFPVLKAFYNHTPIKITLDSGATSDMVRESFARSVGMRIHPASQLARQADGVSALDVHGEVHCTLTRGDRVFYLDALVVGKLSDDILGGCPFMFVNKIGVNPELWEITIEGTEVIKYGPGKDKTVKVRRSQATVVRGPRERSVILPGQYLELKVPDECEVDSSWLLEPRFVNPLNQETKFSRAWPPAQVVEAVDKSIHVKNETDEPILIHRHEHLCQIRHITSVPKAGSTHVECQPVDESKGFHTVNGQVSLNPDGLLSQELCEKFDRVHSEFKDVLAPFQHKYNGASGNIEAKVNMGPALPPQRKGRMPNYNKAMMDQLQVKCDELEVSGVFAKPEDVGVSVEYLNLSFLVNKPSGGTRLVTSFGEIAQYSKPQPSLMPDVDSVLREIGKWRYIIVTDLMKAFYQIPLSKNSMKFCGVATPYKGVRVYTRAAMGMPGSETCLEELMSRILGDLIQQGCVVKIADDLYVGGDTGEELLANWIKVLSAFKCNGLGINAAKTIICPKSTTVLGWIWSSGKLKASHHRIASLCAASPPPTVQGLRAFVGAYKVLSRVLPKCASVLTPLDGLCAGKQSKDKIPWNDESLEAFKVAQSALSDSREIVIPRRDDILWIVCDGSVKMHGISGTLYVLRQGLLRLAGFFNAKLKRHQVLWLPCEVEALAICSSIKHFAPYIIQSNHTTQVLTDSRPCIQAFQKLNRGQFSASARVTSFLTTINRYQVHVRHIAGEANLPSDLGSRNATECQSQLCQICKFIHETEDCVVRSLSVQEVCEGAAKMPFTNRNVWLATQQECPDLRRTHAHLSQGTRPSKKMTKIPDIKRYLRCVIIANDGLLVVRSDDPFQPARELIVVPKGVLDGLLTSLHIKFNHPTVNQLKKVFGRYFFALSLDKGIDAVSSACHHCASLMRLPTHMSPQTSVPPPHGVGTTFAADVLRRYRQFILILRETVTSYTVTCLIENERHETLRDALLVLCADIRTHGDSGSLIRVDPAPGLVKLTNDALLSRHGIKLEIGTIKNVNKNPIAEHAVMELGQELLHLSPEGGPVSQVTLALATANLNARLRHTGLSGRELWTQRDQVTAEQLPIDDRQVILTQHFMRTQNHYPSSKSKGHSKSISMDNSIQPGDLVYLYGDRDKTKARDRYLVISLCDNKCQLRKFTKSQFRSKVYDVLLSQCYKVKHTMLYDVTSDATHLPMKGVDHDSGTNQGEPRYYESPAIDQTYHSGSGVQETIHSVQPDPGVRPEPEQYVGNESVPLVPEALSEPEHYDVSASSGDVPVPNPCDLRHNSSPGDLRRSSRLRQKPSYLEDYVT